MSLTTKDIAKVCHETNRAFCEATGDWSQTPWPQAPDWQRESAVSGVEFHLANPDAGPEAGHERWMAEKVESGWVHGAEKDPDAKTHPCIVPFAQLPLEQQAKDVLFRAVVHTLSGLVQGADTP